MIRLQVPGEQSPCWPGLSLSYRKGGLRQDGTQNTHSREEQHRRKGNENGGEGKESVRVKGEQRKGKGERQGERRSGAERSERGEGQQGAKS